MASLHLEISLPEDDVLLVDHFAQLLDVELVVQLHLHVQVVEVNGLKRIGDLLVTSVTYDSFEVLLRL